MPKKILIIDDESSIVKILSKIATELGLEIRTLTDPAAAYDSFDEFQPDIVMLDLVMPEFDGIDVLNRLLATGTGATIIVMSGFGKSYLRLSQAVGDFHDHPNIVTLAKPFR